MKQTLERSSTASFYSVGTRVLPKGKSQLLRGRIGTWTWCSQLGSMLCLPQCADSLILILNDGRMRRIVNSYQVGKKYTECFLILFIKSKSYFRVIWLILKWPSACENQAVVWAGGGMFILPLPHLPVSPQALSLLSLQCPCCHPFFHSHCHSHSSEHYKGTPRPLQ